MAATFAGTASHSAGSTLTPDNPTSANAPGSQVSVKNRYTHGSSAKQATVSYGKRVTVNAASSVEIDIKTNDGLPDYAGQDVDLSRVIRVDLAGIKDQAGYFVLGGAVGSGWYAPFNSVAASVLVLGADEATTLARSDATGFAVSTGQKFKIGNPGTAAISLDIVVWGS